MKRILSNTTALLLVLGLAACGGGDAGGGQAEAGGGEQPAAGAQEAGGGELTVPDWMSVDEGAQTVTIDLVAGETGANNSWNFNGLHSGDGTIVVPQGFEVTIEFENADQVNPHSVAILDQVGSYPSVFESVDPVFEGAATSGANEMSAATQPGQSESITFTAGQAGEFAAVCLVPAHAVTGMWIGFDVSADGEYGLRQ